MHGGDRERPVIPPACREIRPAGGRIGQSDVVSALDGHSLPGLWMLARIADILCQKGAWKECLLPPPDVSRGLCRQSLVKGHVLCRISASCCAR